MLPVDLTYAELQDITYEEFYDLLWENVSENIVSTIYLDENDEYINSMTFDLYRLYQMNCGITIRVLGRILESSFFNMFRHKPRTENSLDNYYN
jgi:hypothetical protein